MSKGRQLSRDNLRKTFDEAGYRHVEQVLGTWRVCSTRRIT